jgi:hypothetical protein
MISSNEINPKGKENLDKWSVPEPEGK